MEGFSNDPGYIERRAEYQRRYWEIQARCDADPTLDREALCKTTANRWMRLEYVADNRRMRDRWLGRSCVVCGQEQASPQYTLTRHGRLFRRATGELPKMWKLVDAAPTMRLLFHLQSHHYACVCIGCRKRHRVTEKRAASRMRLMPKHQAKVAKDVEFYQFLREHPEFAR